MIVLLLFFFLLKSKRFNKVITRIIIRLCMILKGLKITLQGYGLSKISNKSFVKFTYTNTADGPKLDHFLSK